MSSLSNQMCDPCNVIPLLPIYYINQLLQVYCTVHHKISAYSLRSVVFCCGLVSFSYIYVLRDCHKNESTSEVVLGNMAHETSSIR